MAPVAADQQCVALPAGVSPAVSLAQYANGSVKQTRNETDENGRLQTFTSKSGTHYAFTDSLQGCRQFRKAVLASIEQRKLAGKDGWLVVDTAKNACRSMTVLFPAVDDIPAADIPETAERLARIAGLAPVLKFISPTIASIAFAYPGKEPRTYTLFAKKTECAAYLSGLREVMQAQAASAQTPPGRPGFGTFSGEAGDLKVAVETKEAGTALLIINRRSDDFTFEPTKLVLETSAGKHSPCTAHLLSLQGLGVPTTVAVKAGATEGYLLGACPDQNNGGRMGARFVLREPVTKATVGGVTVKMRRDP